MTTLDALYRAIVDQPLEDTPRLVYADALDERGELGDAERANLIRVQVAAAPLGMDPPRLIETMMRRHGPGYFSATVSHGGDPFEVGERVDVVDLTRRGNDRTYHRLRVTRVLPDDPTMGLVELVLRADDQSTPWPKDEVARHAKAIAEAVDALHTLTTPGDLGRNTWYHLIAEVEAGFGLDTRYTTRGGGTVVATGRFIVELQYVPAVTTPVTAWPDRFCLEYDRGFPSLFRGRKAQWEQHKGWLTERFPITLVRHTTR